ncbi:unnamed protein product [Larinioides sclopetarius]|uniref:Leucine-rich repeat-containing protein 42 n=1 Tax=Larinioides sclopetarius TaxID=280406 RepID=A0AAV2BIP1_9ARAC
MTFSYKKFLIKRFFFPNWMSKDRIFRQRKYNTEKLKKLCLKRNCLQDGAIRKITLPIRMFGKGPKNVEYLDLSENKFTDEIIAGLAVFQKLQCLDLSGSNISRKGIHNLERNCSLKLSPSESTIHPIVTRGWAFPLIEKWHNICRLRRKNRDVMKQNLYYSKKRFLMAKKSISDSSSKIQPSPIKLVFKRTAHINNNVTGNSRYPNSSKPPPEKVIVPDKKAIEEDILAQYM